mmetsp:Transcript_44031/g.71676  ORF Transcript_44031/g.71676 Transcript_44031/m.71676 type:complete len:117 (-) Transcript_44031:311-661(-)|eukprot:CAMPEP_0184663848 /NCGR_PEP_ID=MMETSP0308-20130426/50150_1 /TAXON_ID=38269 /ORGANISM="Gloeochaete witrockiana, Strain SAG 46.84" /LENGTH=116 /DNA_ID=CAMNT_0027106877 /DNA_START=53 /DNA_END=403 /DNA_ORIENTATION=+
MKHLAAYLLAVLGGESSPSTDSIKKILSSVGIEAEEEKLEKLISSLEGKDLNEVIAAGRSKLSAAPVGGAVSSGAAAPSSGGAAAAAPAKEEKKEEKKKEEEKEASEEDMGFSLFD